jgi:hypothetical protein
MFKKFLASPSNRAGLSAWIGTFALAVLQYIASHHIPPTEDLLGLVIGLVMVIQPDNSVTVAQLEKAIGDVQTAIVTKSPEAIEVAVTDGVQIAKDVTNP